MYAPPYNRNPDLPEVLEFMRVNNFVVFVTGTGGQLHASHLPVLIEERGESLVIVGGASHKQGHLDSIESFPLVADRP